MSTAPTRDSWIGLVTGRQDAGTIVVELPEQPSPRGGSGTFLASCSDGRRWWIKPPNNQQGALVVVTEFVVGSVGGLIGAPVCEVAVAEIPDEVLGWEFRPGATLELGFGSASLAVNDVEEVTGEPQDRTRDDNRRRHSGVFALWDWCWGGDAQYLYQQSDDRRLFSHDHGWYLPETGPHWDESALMQHVDEPHRAPFPTDGIDRDELERLAMALDAVTVDDLLKTLLQVPVSWPVSDANLEALGFFLQRRAPAVASRLRSL